MKRKLRSLSLLVALLLITVLMTGCLGGSSESTAAEKQIRGFLGEVETALKFMDAKKLAQLCKYPTIFEGNVRNQEEMEIIIGSKFIDMKDQGTEIQEVKYWVKDSDITISKLGLSAVIEKAEVRLMLKQGSAESFTKDIELESFELVKHGTKWKFIDFDSFSKWLFASNKIG